MSDAALSENPPAKKPNLSVVPVRSNEAEYYEFEAALYGVRDGVLFVLGRDSIWEKMGAGSQAGFGDILKERATSMTFDEVRQYAAKTEGGYENPVKPL